MRWPQEPEWTGHAYVNSKLAVWRAYNGSWSTAAYDNTRTVEAAFNALIQSPIDDVQASLGNPGGNSQTWRFTSSPHVVSPKAA